MPYRYKMKYNADPLMNTMMNYKMAGTPGPMFFIVGSVLFVIFLLAIIYLVRLIRARKNDDKNKQ